MARERVDVYTMACHLSACVAATGADVDTFGALVNRLGVDVESRALASGIDTLSTPRFVHAHGLRCACRAAADGECDVLRLLRAAGAEVAKAVDADLHSWAPLHCAAHAGHATAAELLLRDQRCDVNAPTGDLDESMGGGRWTALHIAVFNGHFAVLRCLVRAGADVQAQDQEEATSLHYASTKRPLVTQGGIELLVDASADVNAQSADGYTALHYAAELGHKDAIRRLMNRGANVAIEAQSRCGPVTSWQLAVDQGHDDCALLLDRTWSDDSLNSECAVTPR